MSTTPNQPFNELLTGVGPAPVRLPARPADGHKGTFGLVTVIGGCAEPATFMAGAPALAAAAALRAGAGLARIAAPAPVLPAVLSICPEATGAALPVDDEGTLLAGFAPDAATHAMQDASAVLVGPGLGVSRETAEIVLAAIGQSHAFAVIDADALSAMATIPDPGKEVRVGTVLTPHPGEFRRLAEAAGLSGPIADGVTPAQRGPGAQALARALRCVVVLKGAATVVSDGERTWVCPAANAALATGGSGDVLAGLIAGLLAANARLGGPGRTGLSAYEAACAGVWAHARAGELWREHRRARAGLLAHELTDAIPVALDGLR